MSSIPTFDPCKQWLGIDAVDLVSPHRVLGIGAAETDPIAIVQAADRRLAALRAIDPGPFTKARDALLARVCEARDGLLATARPAAPPAAWPPTGIAPPPVPAAPPAAPPTEPVVDVVAFQPRPTRVVPRRKARDPGPALAGLALLAAAGTAVAAYVFKPELFGRPPRQVAVTSGPVDPAPADPGEEPAARPTDAAPADPPEPAPPPVLPAKPPRERPPRPKPEVPTTPEPEPQRPEPEATQPSGDPALQAAALASVDEHLGAAYAAIRADDFDAANEAIAAASGAATESRDDEAVDRVSRWKLLARYAAMLPAYREQALAAAKAGREYDVNGTVISVIEVNDEVFVYRVQGQNRRVPRDEIPGVIGLAILSEWFAGDGRAANHIFLGVHHLTKTKPDAVAAADEFRIAARGGEDVATLETLLDDPLVASATDAQ